MRKAAPWLGLALLAGVCLAANHRGQPAQHGIGNFGKVTDTLYRGAQPDEAGIQNLEKLGVKLVINLRMPKESWAGEASAVCTHGMMYTNIPLSGVRRPTDAQIQRVLSAIQSAPGPVFVHCQHGCDRTGTVIACYRIAHDKWTADKALAEAVVYGISPVEREMKRYIADFAKTVPEGAVSASRR